MAKRQSTTRTPLENHRKTLNEAAEACSEALGLADGLDSLISHLAESKMEIKPQAMAVLRETSLKLYDLIRTVNAHFEGEDRPASD